MRELNFASVFGVPRQSKKTKIIVLIRENLAPVPIIIILPRHIIVIIIVSVSAAADGGE